MLSSTAPVKTRIWAGILNGLAYAALLTMIVAAIVLLRGHQAFVERFRVTLAQIMIVYVLGGVLSGAVVGWAWPIGRWSWGSFLLGFLALLPITFAVAFLISDADEWGFRIVGTLVSALVVGGGIGLALHGNSRK